LHIHDTKVVPLQETIQKLAKTHEAMEDNPRVPEAMVVASGERLDLARGNLTRLTEAMRTAARRDRIGPAPEYRRAPSPQANRSGRGA
jgi:hypothetical protein